MNYRLSDQASPTASRMAKAKTSRMAAIEASIGSDFLENAGDKQEKATADHQHAERTGYDPEGFDGGRFNHPQYVVRVREKSNG